MTYLFGLYLDGRKYMTMRNEQNAAGYGHRERVREEHVSIICEPVSSYFGNVTPSSASSKAKEIF